MLEHTIIEGKIKSNVLFKTLCILGIILIGLGLIYCGERYNTGEFYQDYGFGHGLWLPYTFEDSYTYSSLLVSALCFEREETVGVLIYSGIFCILAGLFINFMMSKCAITVTDKRVIGKANFGKRVDLPLNQVSAVAQGMLSSIAVATSSGRIHFWCLANRNDVFEALSNLIGNYQVPKSDVSTAENTIVQQLSNADEIKKYKELLDSGVITQEEFDAKKEQLLGL